MAKQITNSPIEGVNNNMPSPKTISGGEDWLDLSVFADLSTRWSARFGSLFERALFIAKETGEARSMNLFEQRFDVQYFGSHFGPMWYEYRAFDQLGLVWWFRKDPIDHETVPPVRIRIPGEAFLCTNMCLRGFVHWIERFFQNMGVDVRKISVSRVDVCIDLPGFSIEHFRDAHMNKHYVTRSNSRSMEEVIVSRNDEHWRFLESKGLTLCCGRSPLSIRIYEKLAELQHKLSPHKWQAMIDHRWGGEIPECATRIEFELRREALKNRGIDTVEDYLKKRATLVNYLCTEWFRYIVPNGRERKCRCVTLPAWEIVQQGFDQVYIGEKNRNLTPVPKAPCDVSALALQSFGIVRKAAQCQGVEIRTYSEMMRFVAHFFKEPALKKLNPILTEVDE